MSGPKRYPARKGVTHTPLPYARAQSYTCKTTHAPAHTHTHIYTHTYIHTHTRTFAPNAFTCIPTNTRTSIHTLIHTYKHYTCTYVRIYIRPCILTDTRAYMPEYMHTFLRTRPDPYITYGRPRDSPTKMTVRYDIRNFISKRRTN